MSVSQQLRKAIKDSGTSRYRIAKELGVSESTLSRFMASKRGLTLRVLDELCQYLDLKLVNQTDR